MVHDTQQIHLFDRRAEPATQLIVRPSPDEDTDLASEEAVGRVDARVIDVGGEAKESVRLLLGPACRLRLLAVPLEGRAVKQLEACPHDTRALLASTLQLDAARPNESVSLAERRGVIDPRVTVQLGLVPLPPGRPVLLAEQQADGAAQLSRRRLPASVPQREDDDLHRVLLRQPAYPLRFERASDTESIDRHRPPALLGVRQWPIDHPARRRLRQHHGRLPAHLDDRRELTVRKDEPFARLHRGHSP